MATDWAANIDVEASLGTFALGEHIQRQNGVKVLKLWEDLDRYDRILKATAPDVVIEAGSRFGGSAMWFAERCLSVISIDLDRHTARPAVPGVTWIHGDSVDPDVVMAVRNTVRDKRVMVVLDSDHTAPHVFMEIGLYGPLVTSGCYLVVEDTIFGFAPREQLQRLTLAPLIDAGSPLDAVEKTLATDPAWIRDEEIERLHPKAHSPGGWWRRA